MATEKFPYANETHIGSIKEPYTPKFVIER